MLQQDKHETNTGFIKYLHQELLPCRGQIISLVFFIVLQRSNRNYIDFSTRNSLRCKQSHAERFDARHSALEEPAESELLSAGDGTRRPI